MKGTAPVSPCLVLLTAVALAALAAPALAAVSLPGVFSDHMVLQRDMKVPVWGAAEAGKAITVTFAGQTHTATADRDGNWRVELDPMPASAEPRTLTVSGDGEATFTDVLVGEVWLFSGQSNAAMGVSGTDEKDAALRTADMPAVRFSRGKAWAVSSAEQAPKTPAVSFFFAQALHDHLKVPVGVITCAVGGTPIRSWTSRDAQAADPVLKEHVVDAFDRYVEQYPALLKRYEERKAAGDKTMPNQPEDPAKDKGAPGYLFDEFLRPIAGYALRGAEWYQGESDAWGFAIAELYRPALPVLIADWRAHWNRPDLPFFIIQLPGLDPAKDPAPRQPSPWVLVQEVQQKASREIPNVYTVITVDTAEDDIHPRKKQFIGERMARMARANVYGEKGLAWSGPVFERMEIEGSKVRLHFGHVGEGLQIGGGLGAKGGTLDGFTLAGDDRRFHWAQARIDGQTVVVWSDEVKAPAAVRYGFTEKTPYGLFNQADLPASPFRTDEWPIDIPPKAKRVATARRVKTAPKLDGNPADAIWKELADTAQGDFLLRHTYSAPRSGTSFVAGYDDENLYLLVTCRDARKTGPVIAAGADDTDAVFNSDSVEILLDANRDGRTYHRIVANAAAKLYDGRGYNDSADGVRYQTTSALINGRYFLTDWNSSARAAAAVRKSESWILEIAIPWASLDRPAPKAGERMGLQVLRHYVVEGTTPAGSGPQVLEAMLRGEWSEWATTGRDNHTGAMMPTERNIHSPARFGTIEFE